MKKINVSRGVIYTILGGICWGFSGTCGQYVLSTCNITSLELTWIRLMSAGLIMMVISLMRYRDSLRDIWKYPRDGLLLVCFGLFGLMFCQYAYMTAISWSNAATTTMMLNLNLVLVMLYTCLQTRRRPSRKETAGLLLALFGVYMIATGGNPAQMVLSRQGLLWGLLTAAAGAVYILLPRPLMVRWPQVPLLAYGMLIGGVALGLIGKSWTFRISLPLSGWLAVAGIVFIGSIASFLLFMIGVKEIGPVRGAMLAVTEPVAATILSVLWLGTTFSATDFVGFLAILIMIFLLAKE